MTIAECGFFRRGGWETGRRGDRGFVAKRLPIPPSASDSAFRNSGGDLSERGEEGFHVRARADGDAHVVRERREEAAHLDAALPHPCDERPHVAPHVNHHEVRGG